jgi:intermembrane space import and assembly protein 40
LAEANDVPVAETTPGDARDLPPDHSESASATGAESEDADDAEDDDDENGGVFNPATGKINWDCPCLGGMAHGPCGPQFKEAFSCLFFSEEEPKGIDCVDKYKEMQTCFREHPDVYADGEQGRFWVVSIRLNEFFRDHEG